MITCRFNHCKKKSLCHSKEAKNIFSYVNPTKPKDENLEDSEKECSDFVFL